MHLVQKVRSIKSLIVRLLMSIYSFSDRIVALQPLNATMILYMPNVLDSEFGHTMVILKRKCVHLLQALGLYDICFDYCLAKKLVNRSIYE